MFRFFWQLLVMRWILALRRRWCAYRLWQEGCGITYCSSFEEYCDFVPQIPAQPSVLRRVDVDTRVVLVDIPYSDVPPHWVWKAVLRVAQEHYAWFTIEYDNSCRIPKTREDECRKIEYPLTW